MYSFRYFLFPMHIPHLQSMDLTARVSLICLIWWFMREVGIRIGKRKHLNEYMPYWSVSLWFWGWSLPIFSVASVCLSVRLYECLLRFAGWTVGPSDLKFGTHIKDYYILDEFEGQGHQGQKYENSSFQPSIWKGGPRSRSRGSTCRVFHFALKPSDKLHN